MARSNANNNPRGLASDPFPDASSTLGLGTTPLANKTAARYLAPQTSSNGKAEAPASRRRGRNPVVLHVHSVNNVNSKNHSNVTPKQSASVKLSCTRLPPIQQHAASVTSVSNATACSTHCSRGGSNTADSTTTTMSTTRTSAAVQYSNSADCVVTRTPGDAQHDRLFRSHSPPPRWEKLRHQQTSNLIGQPNNLPVWLEPEKKNCAPLYQSPKCGPVKLPPILRPGVTPLPQLSPEPIPQPIGSTDLPPPPCCTNKHKSIPSRDSGQRARCISDGEIQNYSSLVVELKEEVEKSCRVIPSGNPIVRKLLEIQRLSPQAQYYLIQCHDLVSTLIAVLQKRGDDPTITFACHRTLCGIIENTGIRSFTNNHGRDITNALVNAIAPNLWAHTGNSDVLHSGIRVLCYLPLTEKNDVTLFYLKQIRESMRNQEQYLACSALSLTPWLERYNELNSSSPLLGIL
ncbi:hypothetical protein Pelo_3443 [Pelomyxa schiedti]|nr:hypothetical protein Pelo_3443 [Pelomyxa schiedti]